MTTRAKKAEHARQMSPLSGPILGVARRGLTRQVTDVLAEKIISGELPEESLLPSERQLCETLGVSRTVIREGIKALESRGLVRIEHGRGTIAQEPPHGPLADALKMLIRRREHLLDDLLDVRKVLEVHMVMWAAERRTDENLRTMGKFLERMREAPNEPEGYVSADLDFHMEIARATQNPVLLILLEPLSDLSRESRRATFLGVKMVKHRAKEHEEILEFIRRRDAEGAREAMSKHLTGTERDLHAKEISTRNQPMGSRPRSKGRSKTRTIQQTVNDDAATAL